MGKKLYVVITAGGSGMRMGGDIAKQFLTLGEKPILLRTIEMFQRWNEQVNIILVLPSQYKDYWKSYCVQNNLWFKHVVVSGGITRFHSVRNALKYVPDNSIVAIHDGVRPFVPIEMLNRLLKFDFEKGVARNICGVIPVMPAIESMRKKVEDANGDATHTIAVDRDKYMFVQTPQVFSSTELKKCYTKAFSPNFTDDASVVESCGYNVETVEGSRFNIKITTPEDLLMAQIIDSAM